MNFSKYFNRAKDGSLQEVCQSEENMTNHKTVKPHHSFMIYWSSNSTGWETMWLMRWVSHQQSNRYAPPLCWQLGTSRAFQKKMPHRFLWNICFGLSKGQSFALRSLCEHGQEHLGFPLQTSWWLLVWILKDFLFEEKTQPQDFLNILKSGPPFWA